MAAIGHDILPRINSGFGLVHRNFFAWIGWKSFLRFPAYCRATSGVLSVTLFALCSSRYGVELLPEIYTLRLSAGTGARPFRHYVGAIRHLMYGEGMAQSAEKSWSFECWAASMTQSTGYRLWLLRPVALVRLPQASSLSI